MVGVVFALSVTHYHWVCIRVIGFLNPCCSGTAPYVGQKYLKPVPHVGYPPETLVNTLYARKIVSDKQYGEKYK